MASKPLTFEAVPLIEKKMDMTLDEIIKMSKKNVPSKGKRPLRQPIKSQGFLNGNVAKGSPRVQHYIDSRSSIRQGAIAQRRSNFRSNQFQVTKEVARKAFTMPIRNRVVNSVKPRVGATTIQRKADGFYLGKEKVTSTNKQRPQTMDALFANMKEQRMRAMSQQAAAVRGATRQQPAPRRRSQQHQQRGGGRPAPANIGRRQGSFFK